MLLVNHFELSRMFMSQVILLSTRGTGPYFWKVVPPDLIQRFLAIEEVLDGDPPYARLGVQLTPFPQAFKGTPLHLDLARIRGTSCNVAGAGPLTCPCGGEVITRQVASFDGYLMVVRERVCYGHANDAVNIGQ